jgi:predicted nucleic-acid-binding Zn-ribbon protein
VAAGNLPTCPLCGNNSYEREEERTDSKWGFSIFDFN